MKTYIAILRGINVSGQKKVPMAELRRILADKGLVNLQTYIQSGNLVFRSSLDTDVIVNTIKNSIQGYFGFQVPTLVIVSGDMKEVVNNNPFPEADLSKLHVTFLADSPDLQLAGSIPPSDNPNEAYLIKDRVIYVYCPDGYGRTKINNMFFEKHLKITATTRNWKTCSKLLEMAQAYE